LQAGGRRFDPVNLHHVFLPCISAMYFKGIEISNLSEAMDRQVDLCVEAFRFDRIDQLAVFVL
jgi:hypothetical protein